jgi:hypothetical protein
MVDGEDPPRTAGLGGNEPDRRLDRVDGSGIVLDVDG